MTYTSTTVDADGNIVGPIIIGDDHTGSRKITFTIDPISGFTLGQCTCWFGAEFKTNSFLIQGTIVLVATKWELQFDLSRGYTQDLEPGYYGYSVEIRHAGSTEATVVLSNCTVQLKRKYTDGTPAGYTSIDCGFPDSVFDGVAYDGGPVDLQEVYDGGGP